MKKICGLLAIFIIGKLVGANMVVTGSIVKTGNVYTINSRFVDVETGIVKVGKNIRGEGENQISHMVSQLALIITGQAVVTESAVTATPMTCKNSGNVWMGIMTVFWISMKPKTRSE